MLPHLYRCHISTAAYWKLQKDFNSKKTPRLNSYNSCGIVVGLLGELKTGRLKSILAVCLLIVRSSILSFESQTDTITSKQTIPQFGQKLCHSTLIDFVRPPIGLPCL